MIWLKKLWNGEYSLPVSYWVFFVLIGNIGGTILLTITEKINITLTLLVAIVLLAYSVVSIVGTWRAATKYTGWIGWAVIVKVLIVIGVMWAVVGLFA